MNTFGLFYKFVVIYAGNRTGADAGGLFVALLLNQITRFKVGYRVMYYLPVITSWVVASLILNMCSIRKDC